MSLDGLSAEKTDGSTYSTRQTCELLGISMAKLKGYARLGLVTPTRANGSHLYSFQDLVLLRRAIELQEEIPARRVRRALSRLRHQLGPDRSLAGVKISQQGNDIVVRDGPLVWHPDSGQLRLDFGDETSAETIDLPFETQRADPLVVAVKCALDSSSAANIEQYRNADEWAQLAESLRTSDPSRAARAYERALELEPDRTDWLLRLGHICTQSGDTRGGEAQYRKAIQACKSDVDAYVSLAAELEMMSRPHEALSAYEKALSLDRYHPEALRSAARIAETLNLPQVALRYLSSLRRLQQ